MKGLLDPVFEEKILGHAEVRQTFKASGVGPLPAHTCRTVSLRETVLSA